MRIYGDDLSLETATKEEENKIKEQLKTALINL